jgi:phage shock protein PspC (stress-responsive transcriptional regulator)
MGQLTRNSTDSIFGGVISGISQKLDAPVGLLRLVAVISAFLSAGATIGLYLLLWWLLPLDSAGPVEASIWEKRSDGTFSAPFERTQRDRKILGVAGGLARYWGIDAVWPRLGFIVLCTLSLWIGFALYLGLSIFMKAPQQKLFHAPFTSVRD